MLFGSQIHLWQTIGFGCQLLWKTVFLWAHQYLYGDKIDINLWFNSVTQPANTTGIFINHFLLINGKSKQKINVAVH